METIKKRKGKFSDVSIDNWVNGIINKITANILNSDGLNLIK